VGAGHHDIGQVLPLRNAGDNHGEGGILALMPLAGATGFDRGPRMSDPQEEKWRRRIGQDEHCR
jgi:hypothetical protein